MVCSHELACELTDISPELMILADGDLTDRIDHLRAGTEIYTKAGLGGEAPEINKGVFTPKMQPGDVLL